MAKNEYEDFELLIERHDDAYKARILHSPAGQAFTHFELPFSEKEINGFLNEVGRPRRGLRRLETVEMETIQRFGGGLFDAVFAGEVAQIFRESLKSARRRDIGLRLRLRLTDVPELAELPWEFLYDRRHNRFPARSARTPMVRYLEMPARSRSLAITSTIRVLVVAASPAGYSSISAEAEWEGMQQSLDPLVRHGRLFLERLEPGTRRALETRLEQSTYHVFHFIGHGDFSERRDDGVLVLEDDEGRGRPINSQRLGALLYGHPSLRLAVLNACEGARGSRSDPFSGVAQTLAQQEIPAVVGMQFEMPDTAAVAFTTSFYEKLTRGWPVEAAVAAAREALYQAGCELEWGAPVVYLRSADGRLFDLPTYVDAEDDTQVKEDRKQEVHRSPIGQWVAKLLARGRGGVALIYGLTGVLQLLGSLGLAGLLFIALQLRAPNSQMSSGELPILLLSAGLALVGTYWGYHVFGRALARQHSFFGSITLALFSSSISFVALLMALFQVN